MSTTSTVRRVRAAPRPVRLRVRPRNASKRIHRHPAYQKPQKVSPPQPTPDSDTESVFSFTDSTVSTERRGEQTIINIHCCPDKRPEPRPERGRGGCGNNGNWPAFNGCNGYNSGWNTCGWGPNIGCPSFDTLGYPYWPVYSPPTWVSPSPLTQPWNAGPLGCGNNNWGNGNGVSTMVPFPAPPGFCPNQAPPFTSNLLSFNNNDTCY
jgi:hypothetical protein